MCRGKAQGEDDPEARRPPVGEIVGAWPPSFSSLDPSDSRTVREIGPELRAERPWAVLKSFHLLLKSDSCCGDSCRSRGKDLLLAGGILVCWILVCWIPAPSLAGEPIAQISTEIATSIVDSHPYSIVIDDSHQYGYVSICGDVAPLGEAVEDYSAYQVIEFDARTLEVLRTFDVGYFPTDLLLSGSDLWVSCSTISSLFRVDLIRGNVTAVPFSDSSGGDIGYPSGLALGWNGEIIVSSNGGSFDGSDENIVIIDPLTEEVIQRIEVAGGISAVAALEDGSLLVPVGFPGDDFTAAPELQWIDPRRWTVARPTGDRRRDFRFPSTQRSAHPR